MQGFENKKGDVGVAKKDKVNFYFELRGDGYLPFKEEIAMVKNEVVIVNGYTLVACLCIEVVDDGTGGTWWRWLVCGGLNPIKKEKRKEEMWQRKLIQIVGVNPREEARIECIFGGRG